ncbi:MAG: kelch repeat-containing protein [Kofleriaceae bacterium]
MRTTVVLVAGAALALTACLDAQGTVCGELVCAADLVCVDERVCATPEQLDACVDGDGRALPEGAACSAGAGTGVCRGTVCVTPVCGDGLVEGPEACDCGAPDLVLDDGACGGARNGDVGGAPCRTSCQLPRCGDQLLDPGEECDDGNLDAGDGCSFACTFEVCGNEVADFAAGEQCDAGAGLSGDGCASTCELEFDAWTPWTAPATPPARSGAAMAWDAVRRELVLFGGASTSVALDDTWAWRDGGWQRLRVTAAPSPRLYHAMAYAADVGQLVLFGGASPSVPLDDTWAFDGLTWRELDVGAVRPPARYSRLAYDPGLAAVVLVAPAIGGATPMPAETWQLAFTEAGPRWSLQADAGTGAWTRPELVYDADRGAVVLWDRALRETFQYAGGAWSAVPTTGSPPPASIQPVPLVHDPANHRLVYNPGNGYLNGTYTLSLAGAWSLLVVSPNLSPQRAYQAAGYDVATERLVIFGGLRQVEPGGALDDTWLGAGDGFVAPLASTRPRSPVAAVARSRERDAVVFANVDDYGILQAHRGSGGRVVTTTSLDQQTHRRYPAAAYEATTGAVVLYGGFNPEPQGGGVFADTWRFTGEDLVATQVLGPSPGPRSQHLLVTGPDGRVYLHGGNEAGAAETWVLDGAGWSEVRTTPTCVGPGRRRMAAALDPVRGVVVAVGGDQGTDEPGGVYIFDGTCWTRQEAVGLALDDRIAPGFAYQATQGSFVLAGGTTPSGLPLGGGARLRWDGAAYAWEPLVAASEPAPEIGEVMVAAPWEGELWRFGDGKASSLATRSPFPGESVEWCDRADDVDGDGLVGCDDPDCYFACTPTMVPGAPPDPDGPRCGDGVCDLAVEREGVCPADCADDGSPASPCDGVCAPVFDPGSACAADCPVCGDLVCAGDEATTCPIDGPP